MSADNNPEYHKQLRQTLQLIIAVVLIGGSFSVVFGYLWIKGLDDPVSIEIVKEFKTLIIIGTGAALAIFGLGRKVT